MGLSRGTSSFSRTPCHSLCRSPERVDFDRLIRPETLINTPPAIIDPTLGIISWVNEALDLVRKGLTFSLWPDHVARPRRANRRPVTRQFMTRARAEKLVQLGPSTAPERGVG
jgi:hypothetical protein